eukprot:16451867-Heterocapsa_arctica.AAC.1
MGWEPTFSNAQGALAKKPKRPTRVRGNRRRGIRWYLFALLAGVGAHPHTSGIPGGSQHRGRVQHFPLSLGPFACEPLFCGGKGTGAGGRFRSVQFFCGSEEQAWVIPFSPFTSEASLDPPTPD